MRKFILAGIDGILGCASGRKGCLGTSVGATQSRHPNHDVWVFLKGSIDVRQKLCSKLQHNRATCQIAWLSYWCCFCSFPNFIVTSPIKKENVFALTKGRILYKRGRFKAVVLKQYA